MIAIPMTVSRENLLHMLAKDSLERGRPEAAFLGHVDGKVRMALVENDSYETFFKVMWELKVEANRMLTEALAQHDEFMTMMARSNMKILEAIV